MHFMCDKCFQSIGPLEELTIGRLGDHQVACAYCGQESPNQSTHRLSGGSVKVDVLQRLYKHRLKVEENLRYALAWYSLETTWLGLVEYANAESATSLAKEALAGVPVPEGVRKNLYVRQAAGKLVEAATKP